MERARQRRWTIIVEQRDFVRERKTQAGHRKATRYPSGASDLGHRSCRPATDRDS